MQATRELHRFPLQALALFSVLVAAMLAALILAGAAGYFHRSAAQPASITAIGTGPTDADVLGQVDTGAGNAQVQDPQVLIVDGFTP